MSRFRLGCSAIRWSREAPWEEILDTIAEIGYEGTEVQQAFQADGDSDIANIKEQTVDLSPGDLCIMFTDGVNEAENPEGEEFGMERLLGLIAEREESSVSELIDRIEGSVESFSASAAPRDDITLLGVRVT